MQTVCLKTNSDIVLIENFINITIRLCNKEFCHNFRMFTSLVQIHFILYNDYNTLKHTGLQPSSLLAFFFSSSHCVQVSNFSLWWVWVLRVYLVHLCPEGVRNGVRSSTFGMVNNWSLYACIDIPVTDQLTIWTRTTKMKQTHYYYYTNGH
jgi:hypothetical protein